MKSIHKSKWGEIILTLGFLTLVFIPMLFTFIGESEETSAREKRKLTPLPTLSAHSVLNAEYQRDFGKFYEDHFGFRQKFLDGARQFRRTFWNKSISQRIYYGKQGWMFINIDSSIRDFTGFYTQIGTSIDPLLHSLEIKKQWLAQLGVRYLLVPIPGKMSVYPEYLPDRVQRAAGSTRLDAFMKEIAGTELENTVLDTMPILQKAKSERRAYFKTDTHWNEDGAFAVYQATINKLKQWFRELEPVSRNQIVRQNRQKRGDIAIADGIESTKTEQSHALFIKNPCAGKDYEKLESFTTTPAYLARQKALPVSNGCASKSIKALVVHDSFGAYLKQFLSESFGEVVFMPSYDVYGMKSFIKEFDPDIYIDFRADRRFHLLLTPDRRMQSELSPDNQP